MNYYDSGNDMAPPAGEQSTHPFLSAVGSQFKFDAYTSLALGTVVGRNLGYPISPTLEGAAGIGSAMAGYSQKKFGVGGSASRQLGRLQQSMFMRWYDRDLVRGAHQIGMSPIDIGGQIASIDDQMTKSLRSRLTAKGASFYSGKSFSHSGERIRFMAENRWAFNMGNSIVDQLGKQVSGRGGLRATHEGLKAISTAGGIFSRTKYAAQASKYALRAGAAFAGIPAGAVLGGTIGTFLGGPAGTVAGAAIGAAGGTILEMAGWAMLAKDVYDVGKWALNSSGRGLMNMAAGHRSLEFGTASPDTAQGLTNRQRALQAISNSRLNARSALGNEAAILHGSY